MSRHYPPPIPVVSECDCCGAKAEGNPPRNWLALVLYVDGQQARAMIDICDDCIANERTAWVVHALYKPLQKGPSP